MKSVIIGRFEPIHNGHLPLFAKAFAYGDEVLVLLGSAFQARTPKNPFTAAEREVMLRAVFPDSGIQFAQLRDYHDDELWNKAVRQAVGPEARLIGFEKDDSSYYLRHFPEWQRENVEATSSLSATDVRQLLFSDEPAKWLMLETRVPASVFQYLQCWAKTADYASLKEEFDYYMGYESEWGKGPHVTADCLMINNGHVALIRRGHCPGKGTLAMPGGFVDRDERLLDAALRELREETGLSYTPGYVKKFLTRSSVRDFPGRSLRGRVISHVFQFELDTKELPPLQAGDDANDAIWMPIDEIQAHEAEFFEDHFLCICDALSSFATRA